MSAATDQVARLMALTPYLRARPDGVPLQTLADEFGVKPSTMRQDLQTLVMCGLPDLLPDDLIDIDLEAFEDDPQGIVRINNADFMARPTRLQSGEATSLLVALDLMTDDIDEETRLQIAQLRTKLELAAMEGALGKATVVPSRTSSSDAQLTGTITGALRDDRQLQLTYLNATRDEISERVVDPIAVVAEGSRRYLDAWCHRAKARRLFRLDRIQQAETLATPRTHTDLSERDAGDIFEAAPNDVVARLRLRTGARWIASYFPVLTKEETAAGDLEVTLHVSDPRWLVRTVLSAAPDVEVISPAEYAALVTQTASAALAAYDGLQ